MQMSIDEAQFSRIYLYINKANQNLEVLQLLKPSCLSLTLARQIVDHLVFDVHLCAYARYM